MSTTRKARFLGIVLVAVLLVLVESRASAQPANPKKILKLGEPGAYLHKDDNGDVRGISIASNALPLYHGDIESLDFTAMPLLTSLSISYDKLTDRHLVQLQRIPAGLESLRLIGVQMKDREFIKLLLRHKASLRDVSLVETATTEQLLAEIGKLDQLSRLNLSGTKTTDKDLKNLANLQDLHVLDLTGTNITDDGLAEIAKLTNLLTLRLENTKVTDAGILRLGVLESLRRIYVSSTKVTEQGKNALQAQLPDLQFRKDE